jgi:putative ABC transport system ATP-binding protein
MTIMMSKSPITRLINFLKLEKQDLKILPVLIFGYGLISIATPVSVQALVNIVTMGAVLQPLFVISLILFLLLLLSGALYVFESYIVELIQRRIFIRTAVQASENSRNVDVNFYDKENPVEILNRFFDVSILQKSAATLLTVGLTSLLQIIIGSLILLFYSSLFSIFIFIVLALLIFVTRSLGRHATETAIQESKLKFEMASWLQAVAKNMHLFKFYDGKQRVMKKTNAIMGGYLLKRSMHFGILQWQNISAGIIYAAGGTGLLALGGSLVIKGEINLGQFVAAELIIFGVLTGIVRLISYLEYFYDLLAAFDKVGVIEDLPQERNGTHLIEKNDFNSLELIDLEFKYNDFVKPLNKLNFELSTGKSLAILGNPGTGKSTLIKIITKLITPDAGNIKVGKLDLRQIENNSFRNMIGLAANIDIAPGTIYENISLGRNISTQEINNIIDELGITKEFSRFPDGTDTFINESGSPLSSNQLKRLMIARATVGKPNLILIDGLLDDLNETELKAAINMLQKHQQECMLIVTTRFESIAKHFDNTLDINTTER